MERPTNTKNGSPENYSTGLTAGIQNADLVVNGDFVDDSNWVGGTGWTFPGGSATKAAGVASNLTQAIASLDLNTSYIVVTTATRSAGNLTPSIGGNDGAIIAGNVTLQYDIVQAGSNDLFYEADAAFAGTVTSSKVIKVLEAQVVLPCTGRNGQGVLYSLHGHNNLGVAQYIMIFKLGAAADEGSVPFRSIQVPARLDYEFALPIFGDHSLNGFYVCNSTTNFYKTLGAADCTFVAQFK